VKWFYGENQGTQWTNDQGTWLTYADTTPTTPCFFNRFTFQDYVDNLSFLLLESTGTIALSPFGYNSYMGMFREPSTCAGFAAGKWLQEINTGKPIQYAFGSLYLAPFNGTLVPTNTLYSFVFDDTWSPVPQSTSFWQLPSICNNPLPLCPSTFPNGWAANLAWDPFGDVANYLS
jgi:hypothetical protein